MGQDQVRQSFHFLERVFLGLAVLLLQTSHGRSGPGSIVTALRNHSTLATLAQGPFFPILGGMLSQSIVA